VRYTIAVAIVDLTMFRLYTAANLPEAYLILHRLQEAGINAKVFNENAQGGVGELPFTHTYPEIWLEQTDDVVAARRIIKEFEQAETISGTRKCRHCGEENPANFEVCWQCNSLLNDAG